MAKRKDHKVKHFVIREGAAFDRAIDALRKKEDDLPTRSEMLRRLVMRANDECPNCGRRAGAPWTPASADSKPSGNGSATSRPEGTPDA